MGMQGQLIYQISPGPNQVENEGSGDHDLGRVDQAQTTGPEQNTEANMLVQHMLKEC